MTRRTISQSVIDEAAFPVRVKVLAPSGGLWRLLNNDYLWLDRQGGRAGCAQHSAKIFSDRGVAFHFRYVEHARWFLEAFRGLTIAYGTVTAAYISSAPPRGGDRRHA